MSIGTLVTILISAFALVVSLLTASFKLSKAISENSIAAAEVATSNRDLKKSFDEFKSNSRQTHKEIFQKLNDHDQKIVDHETRIKFLEKE